MCYGWQSSSVRAEMTPPPREDLGCRLRGLLSSQDALRRQQEEAPSREKGAPFVWSCRGRTQVGYCVSKYLPKLGAVRCCRPLRTKRRNGWLRLFPRKGLWGGVTFGAFLAQKGPAACAGPWPSTSCACTGRAPLGDFPSAQWPSGTYLPQHPWPQGTTADSLIPAVTSPRRIRPASRPDRGGDQYQSWLVRAGLLGCRCQVQSVCC